MHKGLIHPVVLFGAIDHFKRNKKLQTVGILLGSKREREINITNFFPIPYFEEGGVFYYDSAYFLHMIDLYKKIDGKEEFLGLYTINCIFQNELCHAFTQHTESPVLLQLNINCTENPIDLYLYENELRKIPSHIISSEAEQVGVDHLLKTYYDEKEGRTELIESLAIYEKRLDSIISSIDNMIHTNTINAQLIGMFEDCINEKNKISSN